MAARDSARHATHLQFHLTLKTSTQVAINDTPTDVLTWSFSLLPPAILKTSKLESQSDRALLTFMAINTFIEALSKLRDKS